VFRFERLLRKDVKIKPQRGCDEPGSQRDLIGRMPYSQVLMDREDHRIAPCHPETTLR